VVLCPERASQKPCHPMVLPLQGKTFNRCSSQGVALG
jgi:hypothetical protein